MGYTYRILSSLSGPEIVVVSGELRLVMLTPQWGVATKLALESRRGLGLKYSVAILAGLGLSPCTPWACHEQWQALRAYD